MGGFIEWVLRIVNAFVLYSMVAFAITIMGVGFYAIYFMYFRKDKDKDKEE